MANAGEGLIKIGEASILTGVSPGRIRHYQSLGLLRPARSLSGYRYFDAQELLRLLQIDLLRGLGMGLEDIRRSLRGSSERAALRQTLSQHRVVLQKERDRIARLLAALDLALESPNTNAESVAGLLASANASPRDSLGIFGRLRRPLSAPTAAVFEQLLGGGWGLPVPPVFGRMLLPTGVSDLLEELAGIQGLPVLFERIRQLALEIVTLGAAGEPSPEPAARLATTWLEELAREPLPSAVQGVLDHTLPRIRELDTLNQGFQLWAQSIAPPAAAFLRCLEVEAGSRQLLLLGVLTAPRLPGSRRPRR